MSEQRGDPAARAIAHDADAPPEAAASEHPPVGDVAAGRPTGPDAAGHPPGHAPDDDMAHHAAAVDDHDDHAHMGEMLGPVDTTAWAAGVVGVALGLVVALCFVLATSGIG